MKVMHLITGLGGGGAEMMLLKVVPRLKGEHVVVSMTDLDVFGSDIKNKGIKVYYLGFKGLNLIAMLLRLRRVIKEERPDILNTYLIHADLIGRVFGRIFGIKKVVCSVRNKLIHRPFLLFLDRITSGLVNVYTPNSYSVQKFIIKKFSIPKEKTQVITNCRDASKFDFKIDVKKKRKELGVKAKYAIWGGTSLTKQKSFDTLIKAIAKLGDDYELLLVGVGPLKIDLESLAKKLGIFDRVRFLGTRKDVPEIMKAIDVFVLPSLHEGMSNVTLEAMAARCPIVISNIEENTELIGHNKEGLLFKVLDHEDLAKKIKKIVSDASLRKRLTKQARVKVEKEYSFERTISRLEGLYAELLKNG